MPNLSRGLADMGVRPSCREPLGQRKRKQTSSAAAEVEPERSKEEDMNRTKVWRASSLGALVLLVAVLVAAVFALPAHAAMTITNARAVRGPDASDMVHDLMAADPHLRAAIAAHEKKGQPLMFDAATVILARGEPDQALAPACTLSEESSTFYYDNVKLIFIPDAYSAGYWDGTVEALQYDSQGNLVSEFLADVTGQAPDATTPLTVTYEYVRYAIDKGSRIFVKVGSGPDGAHLGLKAGTAGGLGTKEAQISTREWLGGWGAWAKCTGAWCIGAAVGCGVGNAIDGEIGWLPCTSIGCIGSAIGCTHGSLWK
jgi:hypothetical protein